jgi:hypothetical protein
MPEKISELFQNLEPYSDLVKSKETMEFSGINGLPKEEAVDYLLELRKEGGIRLAP